MHHEPMHFIYETKCLYPEFFYKKRWLDIGSANGNPHPKNHLKNCEYETLLNDDRVEFTIKESGTDEGGCINELE